MWQFYTGQCYTHARRFNGHFPREPGLAGFPFITKGIEASFSTGELRFLRPK